LAKSNVGLDIGASSLKAVEVIQTKKKITIIKAAELELDRGIVAGGEVKDPEALTEAVEQLWLTAGFKKAPVTIGLGGFKIMARQFDLPWEEEEKFRSALPLRLANEMPIDLEDTMLDYHVIGNFKRQTVAPNGAKMETLMQRSLVVAMEKMIVEPVADALVDANVRLKTADFSGFALIRAADAVGGRKGRVPGLPGQTEEVVAEVAVDVGTHVTTLTIHENGRVLFVRTISGGGDSITRALSENLQIGLDSAELLKKNVELEFESDIWNSMANLSQIDKQRYDMSKEIISVMSSYQIQEIRKSVEYFLQHTPNQTTISRVLLSGGSSVLPGFADRLAAELRAPVGKLAPIAAYGKGQGRRPNLDPRMSIAFGLALGARG
jgi:type IV pilus assembly protein PilM